MSAPSGAGPDTESSRVIAEASTHSRSSEDLRSQLRRLVERHWARTSFSSSRVLSDSSSLPVSTNSSDSPSSSLPSSSPILSSASPPRRSLTPWFQSARMAFDDFQLGMRRPRVAMGVGDRTESEYQQDQNEDAEVNGNEDDDDDDDDERFRPGQFLGRPPEYEDGEEPSGNRQRVTTSLLPIPTLQAAAEATSSMTPRSTLQRYQMMRGLRYRHSMTVRHFETDSEHTHFCLDDRTASTLSNEILQQVHQPAPTPTSDSDSDSDPDALLPLIDNDPSADNDASITRILCICCPTVFVRVNALLRNNLLYAPSGSKPSVKLLGTDPAFSAFGSDFIQFDPSSPSHYSVPMHSVQAVVAKPVNPGNWDDLLQLLDMVDWARAESCKIVLCADMKFQLFLNTLGYHMLSFNASYKHATDNQDLRCFVNYWEPGKYYGLLGKYKDEFLSEHIDR